MRTVAFSGQMHKCIIYKMFNVLLNINLSLSVRSYFFFFSSAKPSSTHSLCCFILPFSYSFLLRLTTADHTVDILFHCTVAQCSESNKQNGIKKNISEKSHLNKIIYKFLVTVCFHICTERSEPQSTFSHLFGSLFAAKRSNKERIHSEHKNRTHYM